MRVPIERSPSSLPIGPAACPATLTVPRQVGAHRRVVFLLHHDWPELDKLLDLLMHVHVRIRERAREKLWRMHHGQGVTSRSRQRVHAP